MRESGKRWLCPLLLLVTIGHMLLIYRLSAAYAVDSARLSTSLTQRLIEAILQVVPGLRSEVRHFLAEHLEFMVRKCAHFTEYVLLGALYGADAVVVFARVEKRWDWLPFLCGVAYAATDEWHQTFVPGRSGELRDVLIDSAGVLVGVTLWYAARHLRTRSAL